MGVIPKEFRMGKQGYNKSQGLWLNGWGMAKKWENTPFWKKLYYRNDYRKWQERQWSAYQQALREEGNSTNIKWD